MTSTPVADPGGLPWEVSEPGRVAVSKERSERITSTGALDRRALVTGGSTEIGLGVGLTLAERGYEVVLIARVSWRRQRHRSVASAVAWLDTLNPSVVLPEIELRAVTDGRPHSSSPRRGTGVRVHRADVR